MASKNKLNINHLLRHNKEFLKKIKHAIYLFPSLFDFENKHYFFRQELKQLKKQHYSQGIQVTVDRSKMFRIFEDSYEQLRYLSKEEFMGRVHVEFVGERGQDAGGLMREWFTEIAKEMFNPNLGMFKLADSGVTYYPDPNSHIHAHHIDYFKFIGRIIAKAVLEE